MLAVTASELSNVHARPAVPQLQFCPSWLASLMEPHRLLPTASTSSSSCGNWRVRSRRWPPVQIRRGLRKRHRQGCSCRTFWLLCSDMTWCFVTAGLFSGNWSFHSACNDKDGCMRRVYLLIGIYLFPPCTLRSRSNDPVCQVLISRFWAPTATHQTPEWSAHNHIRSMLNHPRRIWLVCYLSSIANQLKLYSFRKEKLAINSDSEDVTLFLNINLRDSFWEQERFIK